MTELDDQTFGPGMYTLSEMKGWLRSPSNVLSGTDMAVGLVAALERISELGRERDELDKAVDRLLDDLRTVNIVRERLTGAMLQVDDLLCEIISGNQGSFVPHHGTVRMGELALKTLRAVSPQRMEEEDPLDERCECGHAKRSHLFSSRAPDACTQCRCDKFAVPVPEPNDDMDPAAWFAVALRAIRDGANSRAWCVKTAGEALQDVRAGRFREESDGR